MLRSMSSRRAVRAEPSPSRRNRNDLIAAIGGKYGRPPEPGQPNAPDYSFFVDTDHGDFSGMMAAERGGVSARTLLGSRLVN